MAQNSSTSIKRQREWQKINIYVYYQSIIAPMRSISIRKWILHLKYFIKQTGLSLRSFFKITRIPRTTYYYDIREMKKIRPKYVIRRHKLYYDTLDLIQIIHKHHPLAGYQKMTHYLINLYGYHVPSNFVLKIMRQNGYLTYLYRKSYQQENNRYDSYKNFPKPYHVKNIYKQNFSANLPLRKTSTDVTDVRYGKRKTNERVFVSPVIDLYSGIILSYSINDRPSLAFVEKPVKKMIRLRKQWRIPYKTILHTDNGAQYYNRQWHQLLKNNHLIPSIDVKKRLL